MGKPILEQIKEGIALIEKLNKNIKKPADNDAMKTAKETLAIIKKQIKAMEKDESIRLQYEDKVMFSTIQLIFQLFHLAILSGTNTTLFEEVITFIQNHDSVYEVADRIKAAAEARADFGPSSKRAL